MTQRAVVSLWWVFGLRSSTLVSLINSRPSESSMVGGRWKKKGLVRFCGKCGTDGDDDGCGGGTPE